MGLGMMNRGIPTGVGGVSGTALPASTLTRTTAVSTYPPQMDFTRPVDWADGDQAVVQRSQDPTFLTGVTESAPVTLLAATTTYNFGLSNIVSGVWYWRLAVWRTARPAVLNWSNIIAVGDAVAPTITSSNSVTVAERNGSGVANKLAHSLTANEGAYWSIAGTDASLLELAGSTLRLAANADLNYEAKTQYLITVTATDYAGNAATQALTINVSDVNENPSAFTFNDVTGGTRSTLYTSNAITVAGLPTGYAAPLSYSGSGGYKKNGAAATNAPTTVVNGDTVAVEITSSPNYSSSLSGTVSIGGQAAPASDTFTVQTQSDPAIVFSLTEVATPPAHTTATNSKTFTAQSFGAASATRQVIAVIDSYNGGGAPNAVTIGGIAATMLKFSANELSIWIANVPTGTSGDVQIDNVGASSYMLRLWRLDGANPTPTETVEYVHNWDTSPWALFTATTPTGGGTLLACVGETTTGTVSWTNATLAGQTNGPATILSTASRSSAGAAAISVNGLGGNFHEAVALGFAP